MINWRNLALIWLLGLAALQAAPKEPPPPPPPPMPQTQNVTVFRGRSVEIPLRAVGRAPSALKFIVRTQPKHGRLGKIQLTSRKTAIVTYFQDEKSVASFDSFSYAVQAVDTAVSAPATVNIAISEEPPALSVVHALDFGQGWAGQKRSEEIVLRNTGGGTLTGKMVVSEPWKVLGSPDYHLGRREEKKVRLLFAPPEAGEFSARLLFSHDPRSSVTLSGAAQAPLEFDPSAEIEVTAASGETVRSGRLTIRNRTPSTRVVAISLPEQVQGPEEISLPANGEAVVELQAKEDFSGALEDRIDLESDGFLRSLPLRVSAVPPLLRAEPAEGWDFGEVVLKSPRRRPLTLRNEGGTPARLRVETPPEVRLVPEANGVLVGPGEKRMFEVEFEAAVEGRFQKEIIVTGSGTASGLRLSVRAKGMAQKSPDRVDAPRPEGKPSPAQTVVREFEEAVPEETFSEIPSVKTLESKVLSRNTLELRWKKPAPNAVSSLIEFRLLESDGKGRTVFRWKKWQGASFREEGGDTVVQLGHLPPGRAFHIRVVTLDEIGRRSRPSQTFRIVTAPAPARRWLWWTAGLLAVGAGAWGVRAVLRRREAEARADAERLSRLDS
jgi:hypothetical protein